MISYGHPINENRQIGNKSCPHTIIYYVNSPLILLPIDSEV